MKSKFFQIHIFFILYNFKSSNFTRRKMNKSQQNVLNMCNTVLSHFESNSVLWKANNLIIEEVTDLKEILGAISTESFKQTEKASVGLTKDKDDQLELMLDLTYQLVTKIRPHARKSKNNVLLKAVDYSLSALGRGAEEEIIKRCQLVHDKGKEHLTALVPYQVTIDELATLQAAINKFKPMAPQRNTVANERVTATSNLPQLFAAIREKLEILDDLVESQIKNKDFINTHFNTRKINS